MPLKPGESRAAALARLEHLLDLGLPAMARPRRVAPDRIRGGPLRRPGPARVHTWRDRPAVDRGDGVFLAGDLVAAPGFRAEVSINSALHAARLAIHLWTSALLRCGVDPQDTLWRRREPGSV